MVEDILIAPRGRLAKVGSKWKVTADNREVASAKGPGEAICKARENGVAVIWHPGEITL